MAYTLHDRSEWLRYSRYGMSGPSQDRSAVTQIVIHYNGGNADLDGPDDIFQDEDYARVLARMNDQYWSDPNRGYALGYNYGCGPDGDLWEIRGTDIRCGANGCQLVNVPGIAIQVTTTAVTAPPTQAQIKALKNQWVPWLRRQYPRALTIVGHRDVRSKCSDGGATACPGPQLYPLVQQGYFNTPDQGGAEEEDMPLSAEDITKVGQEVIRILRAEEFRVNLLPSTVVNVNDIEGIARSHTSDLASIKDAVAALNAKIDALPDGGGGGGVPAEFDITLTGKATPPAA